MAPVEAMKQLEYGVVERFVRVAGMLFISAAEWTVRIKCNIEQRGHFTCDDLAWEWWWYSSTSQSHPLSRRYTFCLCPGSTTAWQLSSKKMIVSIFLLIHAHLAS